MSGMTDLDQLLAHLDPELDEGEVIFCVLPVGEGAGIRAKALGWFEEAEGTTAILDPKTATASGLAGEGPFRRITLRVHSSLDAVGLLARVTTTLAEAGIAVNVVSASHHDHLFVRSRHAQHAVELLRQLQGSPGGGSG